MTEAEWLGCDDPEKMLKFVQGHASQRKLRLFAVWCCGRLRESLYDIEEKAVAVVEKFLAGEATEEDRAAAFAEVRRDVLSVYGLGDAPVAVDLLSAEAQWAAEAVLLLLPSDRLERAAETRAWCNTLRDLLGPIPFRPLPLVPASVLTWNGGCVIQLARAIYDERTFDNQRLAVLADALEEAGLTDEEVLKHCRQDGAVHLRGCWVVDLLLGKA